MNNPYEKANPCIDCIYAVPKTGAKNCSWAERFEPVKGWVATKAFNKSACNKFCQETWAIEYCPNFKADPRALQFGADFDAVLERMEAAVKAIVANPFGMTEEQAIDGLYTRAEVSTHFQPAAKVLTVIKLQPKGAPIAVNMLMARTRLSDSGVARGLTILTGWGWQFEVGSDIDYTVTIKYKGFKNPEEEENRMEDQNKMVLDWLKENGAITAQEAVEELNIYRLSARIYDLRAKGHTIRTKSVSRKRADGRVVSYAKYILED